MNEYQESRTKEFSLIGVIFYCLEKWRWIIIWMLAIAIIGGIYKYRLTVNENHSKENNMVPTENTEENTNQKSIEFYEHAIEELEYESEMQKNYLERSVVMQLDPYHVPTGTLSYYLESDKDVSGILAAYSTFITSGQMAERLYSVNSDIAVEDLRYLISFFQNSSTTEYKIGNGNDQIITIVEGDGCVFQIQIRIPESDLGKQYLDSAKEIIEEYSSQVQIQVAEHKLTLLDSVQSEMIDSEIQEYQSAIRLEYMTSVRNLQTLRTECKTIQGTESENSVSIKIVDPVSSALKFAVLGLIMGAFLSCLLLLGMYILGGRLQDMENFNEEFGMPLLGIIRISGEKRKLFGFVDSWIFQLRGGAYAKTSLEEQIKISAANVQASILNKSGDRKINKIMLSGTIKLDDVDTLCRCLASEIPEITFSSYKQIIYQSSALKELEKYDGILFVEKKGGSETGLIAHEKKLALDRNVEVVGTVVVC